MIDIKKKLEQYERDGKEGPSWTEFLVAKDAIIKMHEAVNQKTLFSDNRLTLSGMEIECIFKVCPELAELAFQYSA